MNLADIWEAVADRGPDAVAQVHGERRSTYGEFEEKAARLAGGFAEAGIGPGSKVALYLYNCLEYLESTFAAFKLEAVPVNVNYRYLADELHYLLDNADAEVLVYHGALAGRVEEVRPRLPKLRLLVQVSTLPEDRVPLLPGAVDYDELLRASRPAPRRSRSPENLLLLYTGGTTGLPKGVMWRHADLFRAFSKAYAPLGDRVPRTVSEAAEAALELRKRSAAPVSLAAPPLMHGMAWFTSMSTLLVGGTVVSLVRRSFDPHELWRTVERERVTSCVIVGDAFARPMVRALEEAEAQGKPYDLSSLFMIVSGGVMWTAPVKKAFTDRGVPLLIDGLGSSEGTGMGMMITTPQDDPTTARFRLDPETRVVTEDGRFVEPGSGEIGLLAVAEGIPLGYYKDEERTATTFRVIGGKRYALPGDWARVEADGTITLLGRGSVCINTGGEKVFPEEVEEVIKLHPAVEDCVVVGVPDERWGEAIAAVVAVRAGERLEPSEVVSTVKAKLASYKAPKHVVFVPSVLRSPAGKADYRWARETAREALRARASG